MLRLKQDSTDIRVYQRKGSLFLRTRKRVILADEMGLGKTRQTIEAIKDAGLHYILVVCPRSVIAVWQEEIAKWWPERVEDIVTVLGHYTDRRKALDSIVGGLEVVLTTYDIILAHSRAVEGRKDVYEVPDFTDNYEVMVFDEAHRYRNRKSKTFKVVKSLDAPYLFQLTGTPSRQGPQDLWTMLHRINPKFYRSYWKFVMTFCETVDNGYGKEIVGVRKKTVDQLKKHLAQYMIRRRKVDVLEELPIKSRDILPATMTKAQEKFYRELNEYMISETKPGGTLVITPTALAQLTRLRQTLVCPKLLGVEDYGGGLKAIADKLQELDVPHVVIFTPFAQALPHIEDFLTVEGYGPHIYRLQGGMDPKDVRENIQAFKETQGIMLCTIKFAQGFSLETASTAFFLSYEYSPDENYQAEDRLHRMTSKSAVNIYYVMHHNTIDVEVLDILFNKQENVSKVLGDPQVMRELLERAYSATSAGTDPTITNEQGEEEYDWTEIGEEDDENPF